MKSSSEYNNKVVWSTVQFWNFTLNVRQNENECLKYIPWNIMYHETWNSFSRKKYELQAVEPLWYWSVKCNSVQFPFLTPVVKDSAVEMNMHRQIKTYYYLRYSIKEFSLPDWWLESSFATLTHVTNILLYEYTWWNVCAYLPWQLCG